MLSNKDMKTFLAEEEAKLAQDLEFVSNIKNEAKQNNIKKILTIVVVVLTTFITSAYNIGSEYEREKARKYEDALVLKEKEMYQDAIDVFDKLYGHKNSDSLIRDCKEQLEIMKTKKTYENAVARFNAGDFKEAAILLTNVKSYQDAKEKASESYYKYGQECVTAKDYEKAYYAFVNAEGYLDSNELKDKYYFSVVNVGGTIKFGKYEQDNNLTNGAEDLVWYILHKEGNKVLLLSKYVIGSMAFDENLQVPNTATEPFTYANSPIRTFVNETFYNTAFSEEDKKSIITMEIVEKIDEENSVTSENKVFIPTYEMVTNYVKTSTMKSAYGSEYAKPGVTLSKRKMPWWTCSILDTGTQAMVITDKGSDSRATLNTISGIRPAIWVDFVE